VAGASVCKGCPAGSYCGAKASVPTRCGRKYYCPEKSPAPLLSAPGSYCPSLGMSVPLPCPANFFCRTVGLSVASPCAKGFVSQPGATSCSLPRSGGSLTEQSGAVVFVAEALLNLGQKAAAVCQNLPATLQAYDEALAAVNPEGQFGSVATSLDGVACPSGACPCAGLRRMLLGDAACRLEVRTIQTEATAAVPDGYDVAVTAVRQCPADRLDACIAGTDTAAAAGAGPPALRAGAIAGIVVGAAAVVLLAVAVAYCLRSRSSLRREQEAARTGVKGDFVNIVHGT
jgi:hypothetical protein